LADGRFIGFRLEDTMIRPLLIIATCAGLAVSSGAFADDGGAAAGGVTGAVAGAVVGGPVGAVVGGAAGAAIGGAASGPERRDTVVVQPGAPAPCDTTTVRRENAYGDAKTVTRSNC
jgi:hypothetical protein